MLSLLLGHQAVSQSKEDCNQAGGSLEGRSICAYPKKGGVIGGEEAGWSPAHHVLCRTPGNQLRSPTGQQCAQSGIGGDTA